LNYQNNYVERSCQLKYQKIFVALLIIYKIPTKLFLDLYTAKFF